MSKIALPVGVTRILNLASTIENGLQRRLSRSKECSWNKGKKRDKNLRRLSDAVYPSKLRKSVAPVINFDPRPSDYRRVFPEYVNRFAIALQILSQDSDGQSMSMWETQHKITYKDYDLTDPFTLHNKVNILRDNLTLSKLMEIPGTQGQSTLEQWFSERWCRLTACKCFPAFKVGKLIIDAEPNAASEAYKFISKDIWGVDVMPFQSHWMLYGLQSEAKAILKFENETLHKVRSTGLWVNPKFPFLPCSPDGLVGDDTVIEIKSLKIFEQNTIETVTCSNTPVPTDVLRKQCFQVQDGKCVLKRNHSYYYQCQHILLTTERKFCKFILHAKNGPDSVEKIVR